MLTSLERADGLEIVGAAGRIVSAPMGASSNGLDRRFVEAGPSDLGARTHSQSGEAAIDDGLQPAQGERLLRPECLWELPFGPGSSERPERVELGC